MAITLCDFDIKKNIKYDCDKPLIRQYEPYAIIANRRNVSWSSNGDGTFKISCLDFYVIRNKNDKPFEGTISEFENENPYGGRFKKTVAFDIPEFGAEIGKEAVEPIFAGEEFLMIFEKKDKSEKTRYEIFGLENGLKIESGSRDMVADGVWKVVLTETGATIAEVGFWDTDEATTVAQFERYLNYEWIRGLSLASGTVTPQVVYLEVDADKECKVILPDNTVLTSTGGVINDTWTGAAGAVTLLVDKTSQKVYFGDYDNTVSIISDYIGDLYTIFNGIIQVANCMSLTSVSAPNATNLSCTSCMSLTSVSAPNAISLYCGGCTSLTSVSAPNAISLYCGGCTSLTSVSAPNATSLSCDSCTSLTSISAPNATGLYCGGCTSLTSISAPNATNIDAPDCALTSNAIASLLAELVATGNANGTLDISGGTNASYPTWSQQAKDDALYLSNLGWSITYNE